METKVLTESQEAEEDESDPVTHGVCVWCVFLPDALTHDA